jgi:hypothetical protein
MKKRILILLMLVTVPLGLAAASADSEAPGRKVTGDAWFTAPWEGGMTIWLSLDIREVNPKTHRATGQVNWKIWHDEWGWRELDAHPSCVLFGADVDEDPNTAIFVSRIVHKSGWGEGEPGEYAYWWVRDGEPDQFGINYFSFDPFLEFWPRGKPTACAYFSPGMLHDLQGDLVVEH